LNQDYILCECSLSVLENFVTELEKNFKVVVAKSPSICMTMVKAEDSVESQPFYLGEALTTECQLLVNDRIGYGICIGDEPVRAYCIAFFDAIAGIENDFLPQINQFLSEQLSAIELSQKIEHNHILRTKVDFKIMEQD
jgi:phosphonate C-P lyase system protein PhnG